MTFKTHMIGGIALAGVAALGMIEVTGLDLFVYYGASIVGSLLPDIDHPKSWISQNTFGIYKLFKGLGHRGATHSLFAVFMLEGILLALFGAHPIVLGLGIGYFSHLLLDMLNPRGVPLAYPFFKKKFKVAKLRTDESGEYVVAGMLIMAAVYCVWQTL